MTSVGVVIVGFVAGLFTMSIVSFYKWFLKYWNNKLD
jgi:hypothetical protein